MDERTGTVKLMLSQAAEVRLGRQRAPRYEVGDHVVPYLRSANVVDGELDLSDVKTMNFTPAEQEVFGLADGDVLVTEGSGSLDTVGTSAVWRSDLPGTVCFQNTLLRLRPRVGVTDGRYLSWWARHAHASRQMAAVASGANIQHIGADGLKRLSLVLPSLDEQRQIADFLDDRIARIDQIIISRREQLALVRAHEESALEELVQSAGGERRPLQALTDPRRPIQYGIVLPGTDFEGGVPIIKGGDIGSGRLGRLELKRTDPEIERGYVRSRVRPGDLVIAIRGSVGEVGVVPHNLRLANLTQDSARIAAFECDMAWLRAVMESPGVQASMGARVTGSTVKGINIEDLRKVPIRVPSPRSQREAGAKADALRVAAEAHVAGLHRSVALMQECKQSLITAAVTGEIDVTTASSGLPG